MPEIRTKRLLLRPPTKADAPGMAELAGDFDIARMVARIPHPYLISDAEDWLATLDTPGGKTREAVYAATLDGRLIGMCSHIFSKSRPTAEIGYWVGKPYWRQGYATEMTLALVRYGFLVLGLDAITVSHLVDNPASAAVIVKFGFAQTGRRQIGCLARDAEVEAITYALTRSQAEAQAWYHAA